MSEKEIIASVGFFALFFMMFLRVPVGIAMSIVGVGGFAAVVGLDPALNLLSLSPIRVITNYELSVIPMFILMGVLASASGMSAELFKAANTWLGGRRGGVGTATIASCAGFSAISGSSVATAATMTKIALPEMQKLGYGDKIATGMIAAGGTLGILIPPSVIMVVYAFLAGEDVGKMFVAGVVPGILAVLMHMAVIWIIGLYNPSSVPAGRKTSFSEKIHSLRGIWAITLVFIAIIGGIYKGFVTPTEAAALGAIVTFLISYVRGQLDFGKTVECLKEALKTSVSIYTVIIGATLFSYFLTVTQVPQNFTNFLVGLNFGPLETIGLILFFFIVLGCILESMAMMILLVPIVLPVINHFGLDPIWFGILMVVAVELGLITPPVGMNIFVIKSVAPSVKLTSIMKGTMPFVMMDVVRLVLLVAFPAIVMYVPSTMAN